MSLKLEHQLCFALYTASRRIIKMYHPMLSELQLTYTQYITMLALWSKDGQTVSELGAMLSLDSGTLTPLLKKMESMALLKRVRSAADERNVEIILTDVGKNLKHKASGIPGRIASCVPLNIEEAMVLHRLLKKITDLPADQTCVVE